MKNNENLLRTYLEDRDYSKIMNLLMRDLRAVSELINAATEEEVIAFVRHFGPQAGEVMDDNLHVICTELLPLAYKDKHWYNLCVCIYGLHYHSVTDPICGGKHPLAFAAADNCADFGYAYIEEMKKLDALNFDQMSKDGRYRPLPEELVLSGCVELVACCLENGMNPNTFTFRGNRLLDAACSERMRELLRSYGAKSTLPQERHLVEVFNGLRYHCLDQRAVQELLSTEPLMKLSWHNGPTGRSREQCADLYLEAALWCHYPLLQALYPFAEKDFDEERRRTILQAVLGYHEHMPFGRNWSDDDHHLEDVARSLEVLCEAGFTYGGSGDPAKAHPIVEMFQLAKWNFYLGFYRRAPDDMQMRIFSALWKIGGSPADDSVLQA